MSDRPSRLRLFSGFGVLLILAMSIQAGCRRQAESGTAGSGGPLVAIQNAGSDTMVNVAQAWAERYAVVDPGVSVEVSGGGSGTGIAGLMNGTVDIANCSRKIKDDERRKIREAYGHDPQEFIVGFDAMAIFVHPDNPIADISLEQLAEIYRENGTITRWSQLGVKLPGRRSDKIIVVSRQSNSGTYFYFRESVLGENRDFRLGTLDLHGSKDVVELISRTPNAIGYSGMGYATPHARMLKIRKHPDQPAVAATVENSLNGTYPIARPLVMYICGSLSEPVKRYLDWAMGPEGQDILVKCGYVPLEAPPVEQKGSD